MTSDPLSHVKDSTEQGAKLLESNETNSSEDSSSSQTFV